MQLKKLGAVCTLIVLFALPAFARAQTIASGTLEGSVHSTSGAALSDVSVSLQSADGGGTLGTGTTREGRFRLPLLPPGTYTVIVERLGYRPKRIEQVTVQSGGPVLLDIQLEAAPPPVESADVVRFSARAPASRAGVSQSVSLLRIDSTPWERRELSELASLATSSTSALEIEGLPARFSQVFVDGIRYPVAQHAALEHDPLRAVALPFNALQSAEVMTADPDLEWSGFAGGVLSTQTRRGSSAGRVSAFGSGSGGPLQNSKFFDVGAVSHNSAWGGVALSGPLVRDTAHFALGFEARRDELPLAAAWAGSTDATALVNAARVRGVDLNQFTNPFMVQTTTLSGLGRFDWQLGAENALRIRAGFGQMPSAAGNVGVARAAFPSALAEGTDLLLNASLGSMFRRDWAHELRVGLTRSRREYNDANAVVSDSATLPATRVLAGSAEFGTDPRLPATFERTDVSAAQSLVVPSGAHHLKVGYTADLASHDNRYAYGRTAQFVFSGPAQLTAGQGVFRQNINGTPSASFSTYDVGFFAEDIWTAAPGLSVLFGVRYDIESIPKDKIALNQKWFDYTGLSNNPLVAGDSSQHSATWSPRVGASWDVGGRGDWIVHASAGVYAQPIEPEVLTELLVSDSVMRVQRTTGALTWPIAPSTTISALGTPLAIMGPNFRGPVTRRGSFGVSHRVSPWTTVQVSASYRQTDYLARRTDLNLLTPSVAHDQYDRPIYGTLTQFGELVTVARPNRRFSDFDVVSALTSDGRSRYWGITAGVERDIGASVGFFAHYTYSHTTDDWLGARGLGPDAQLSPFPESTGTDWREGTSDFDLPHRVAAGVELSPRAGSIQPRITALYRFRSGYPFTPGFADGVDANGDGSGVNDPAFIDTSINGVSQLVSDWKCLSSQVGRFAERNACRQPGVHALDLRVSVGIAHSDRFAADVFADGLNLLESDVGEPDRAVYLIDPSRTIQTSAAVVTVPLVANPHFGKTLTRTGTGRQLRIGIKVNH